MSKLIIVFFLVFGIVPTTFSQGCDWESMKAESKEKLKPFKYYAFKVSKIISEEDPLLKELQIPLFHNAEYRFIFHKGDLPETVNIEIWNAPANFPGRKLLFTAEAGEKVVIYDPPASNSNNRIYINYLVPSILDEDPISGCIVFYSGFKN